MIVDMQRHFVNGILDRASAGQVWAYVRAHKYGLCEKPKLVNMRASLPFAEIPGLKFDFARAAVAQERALASQASVFAATGQMSAA